MNDYASGSKTLPNMSIADTPTNVLCRVNQEFRQAVVPTLSCTSDSAEKERARMNAEFKDREQNIKAEWGYVAKTMVSTAHAHMQEHIHHAQRDLTAHMEECLDQRTAEINQQAAVDAGAEVSAVRGEAIQHVQKQEAHVAQEARKQVSAHMIHVEQTAEKIIEVKTVAVVQDAKVFCANIQSQANVAVSQAQEAAHAATSSKEAAVQDGINTTMQTADEIYAVRRETLILETQNAKQRRASSEISMNTHVRSNHKGSRLNHS